MGQVPGWQAMKESYQKRVLHKAIPKEWPISLRKPNVSFFYLLFFTISDLTECKVLDVYFNIFFLL